MPSRLTRPPLRWRVAALAGAAIAVLSVVASLTSFWVVRQSLLGDLQRSLRDDVRRVAEIYQAGGPGAAGASLAGPTGGVIVQLYDAQGGLLAASSSAFEQPDAVLPGSVLLGGGGLRNWSGRLAGMQVVAAVAPFDFGIAAVIADTAFIGNALAGLARALLVTALLLVAVSAVLGYLIAGAAIAPIRHLARQAARLGPRRLEPIGYAGPDDELGQLSRVLNDLIVRLKAAADAQRQFLAETSHELRTPLTSLQGFLDRAIRRSGPEVARELADARRIAGSMTRLVEDLLQLSRGELVSELTPHLVELRSDVLEAVAEEYPGVRVEAQAELMVLGDPDRLRQLLRNLVANAVRAAGEGALVELGLRREGERALVTVLDRGPGIAEEAQERIFEKFYKGAGGGAGLGLAIARQIAEQHRGTISLSSRPGLTVFEVSLPAIDVPD